MALPKLFQRIFWHNNTTPAIQEDNLNAMSKGLSDVDDRVIGLAGTIMEDVPQIQEDIEELEADMALIDTKIASATAEADRATTAANNAAASVISAGNKALVSEGWAKGTQNGTAVGSSSPYYHNNAEYFKNQARSFTPQGYQDLVDDVDSLNEALTSEASARAAADTALGVRIDQIIAPSGEAPSAAEVTDARIGADGKTYASLGAAIRTQFDSVKSASFDNTEAIDGIVLNNEQINLIGSLDIENGNYTLNGVGNVITEKNDDASMSLRARLSLSNKNNFGKRCSEKFTFRFHFI